MSFDYLADFPIPLAVLPAKLRSLLEPISNNSQEQVEVAFYYELDENGPNREILQMQMAVVTENDTEPLSALNSYGGVVAYSVPVIDKKGGDKVFNPSIDGHEYVVASWGSGSFNSFSLAEKIWMALGLTPRCVGNEHQRLIYDDLSLPEFGIAEGEISSEYYWSASRNVRWTISNEYLRKYLWMRGACGVRVFFYEALVDDLPELRNLMADKSHIQIAKEDGWFDLDIREDKNKLLIQVSATVKAVSCELCSEQSADGMIWPDIDEPMTKARANALSSVSHVYLDDRFLQRYEQNKFYETTPVRVYGQWHCSPTYRGQWSFTDCVRVGRNLIRVPMRELYKPKPDREIIHAHQYVKSLAEISHLAKDEENIVSKTDRLIVQLLNLGDNLSLLAGVVGIQKSAVDLISFSRNEIIGNGWISYPQLSRLAQVAPLNMNQQDFLSRCKSMHEIWQRIPDGILRLILEKAGCPRVEIKQFGSLKLLQSLLNIVELLNKNEELSYAFPCDEAPEGFSLRNQAIAALFLNNDLRIADAHDTVDKCLSTIKKLGFDTANLDQGYGKALDFVMDGVVDSVKHINSEINRLLTRGVS